MYCDTKPSLYLNHWWYSSVMVACVTNLQSVPIAVSCLMFVNNKKSANFTFSLNKNRRFSHRYSFSSLNMLWMKSSFITHCLHYLSNRASDRIKCMMKFGEVHCYFQYSQAFSYCGTLGDKRAIINSETARNLYPIHSSLWLMAGGRHGGWWNICTFMMTSSNGNIFRVTGPLCGELTGHRWILRTKASDAELWCFLGRTIAQTIVRLVIRDAIVPLWRHSNALTLSAILQMV